MEAMSHNQRLYWLKTLGYDTAGSFEVPELGTSMWVNGVRHGIPESFWLASRDGRAVIHGENTPVKTWEELQAWITEKPEAKKPLAAQRNLFD
jgi:hypothetical protein